MFSFTSRKDFVLSLPEGFLESIFWFLSEQPEWPSRVCSLFIINGDCLKLG